MVVSRVQYKDCSANTCARWGIIPEHIGSIDFHQILRVVILGILIRSLEPPILFLGTILLKSTRDYYSLVIYLLVLLIEELDILK